MLRFVYVLGRRSNCGEQLTLILRQKASTAILIPCLRLICKCFARPITRYGLAADALIALGGLSAAARDEDGGEARRMLVLTKESLNDILTIGVNNNLNKTD